MTGLSIPVISRADRESSDSCIWYCSDCGLLEGVTSGTSDRHLDAGCQTVFVLPVDVIPRELKQALRAERVDARSLDELVDEYDV